ncbi:hypothetical protein BU26DRAFT_518297 [Trematosphaeria pertusa]|uniref:Uncharacterized protein n=1 Tax=Trematosphaeria pertusa TaxID=390896 RepID=A0A6A6IHR8_9PLEO|nr:uncharacterized protein BU26DRAFT_518297 [Trematosphaeria pertusa]KAF2249739.1 hypothetical protein BU26DRAFT_518297 [Trematosphaeria pertusa]
MEIQRSDPQSQSPTTTRSQTLPSPESLLATAKSYLNVFTTLNASTIAHIQTSDYTHEFAPQSTNPPGLLSRAEFADFVSHLRSVIHDFKVTAREIWPNPSLRQVVIRADSAPAFRDEVKDGEDEDEWTYRGEYISILTFDQKREKVSRALEFVDSKGTDRVKALIARAWAKKESLERK